MELLKEWLQNIEIGVIEGKVVIRTDSGGQFFDH
jgi:hypothetical protein